MERIVRGGEPVEMSHMGGGGTSCETAKNTDDILSPYIAFKESHGTFHDFRTRKEEEHIIHIPGVQQPIILKPSHQHRESTYQNR